MGGHFDIGIFLSQRIGKILTKIRMCPKYPCVAWVDGVSLCVCRRSWETPSIRAFLMKIMSTSNYYNFGVVNNDHSKHVTVNVPAGTNVADIVRSVFAEDITPAEDVPSSSVSPESHSEKEPRLKQLFDDPKRTEEESNRFLNFLSDHNISSRLIDSSQDNPILKAVVCFCVKWRNLRYIESKYSPSAVLRFLTDTCSLQTDRVADRAIANALGVMIKNGYDKVLYQDVCDYF